MHHKPDGFLHGYNVQVAVEGTLQLIVGGAIRQGPNGKQQPQAVIHTIHAQAGHAPDELLADSGYYSENNLKHLARTRIDGYIATCKTTYGERPAAPRGSIPRDATRVERMARKLQTKMAAAIYATRKRIVEPVPGRIKQGRWFREFLSRGLEKVRGEWALVCSDAQRAEALSPLLHLTRVDRGTAGPEPCGAATVGSPADASNGLSVVRWLPLPPGDAPRAPTVLVIANTSERLLRSVHSICRDAARSMGRRSMKLRVVAAFSG
ncbi:MAG TPA: transposase [Gemmatimonadales bacterium]|nr:transposase [Gemmatimonadales bacterium]